jgi:hypothetical protein
VIETADGTAIEAVVLGRCSPLMRRHLDLAEPHLWVVYPRSRDGEQLHLQLVGVWEPSTLASETSSGASDADGAPAPEQAPDDQAPDDQEAGLASAVTSEVASEVISEVASAAADAVPEGDDYFSVRGELIYTRPETGDLVVKIRQLPGPMAVGPPPSNCSSRGIPWKACAISSLGTCVARASYCCWNAMR